MIQPENLLEALRRNPETLGTSFQNPLSFQEEMMLVKLEKELGHKVHEILDLVLAANAEIILSDEKRAQVIELSYFQKAISHLLTTRGSLRSGNTSLN